MRALVLGGAGFVGKYLTEALLAARREVIATKLPNETVALPVESFDLDLEDASAVISVLKEASPDEIYHLAAQSSVRLSWEKPALTTKVNAVGAVHLYEGIRRVCPGARCLVVGSSEEYGNIDYSADVSESVFPQPNNVYALTKYFQEELARLYGKVYSLNFVMTRSFNHVGPYQSRHFVVADFCAQIAEIEAEKREPIIRVGNLDAYRDFTDVRDIVRAYLLLAEKGMSGQVYNVGSGRCMRIAEILDILLSFAERKIRVEQDPEKLRPTEIPRICANCEKLSALGWRPTVPIRETLEETLNYYRKLVRL